MKYFTITNANKVLSVLILVIFIQNASSQDNQSRKTSKTYQVSKMAVFNIQNKYGNIDLRDWEKDEIEIDAEIILHITDKSKAEEAFQNVSIVFNQEGNQISVSTNYKDEFFDILGTNNSKDDKKFEVNYIVMMPSSLKVNLENKYGNVFISKLKSQSSIVIKYGSLQINQISASDKDNLAEIILGYSKGSIENCQWLKIELSYSKINIQDGQGLTINSKYSKFELDKGTSIKSESKYDTYDIGIISEFFTEAHYSNFKFIEISKKIEIDSKYSDFRVNNVPGNFDTISIKNSYGSISLGIDPASSYSLNADARYANIHYPDNSRVNRNQENTELRLNGIVGQDKNPLSTIRIETAYGGVNLIK